MGYINTTFPGKTSTTNVDSGLRVTPVQGPNLATVQNQLAGLLSAAVARKNQPPQMAQSSAQVHQPLDVQQPPTQTPRYVKLMNWYGQPPGEVQVGKGEPGAVFGGDW